MTCPKASSPRVPADSGQAPLFSVLKQKKQLSERDKKVTELEQYVDDLLVCVMKDSPDIRMSLNSQKRLSTRKDLTAWWLTDRPGYQCCENVENLNGLNDL